MAVLGSAWKPLGRRLETLGMLPGALGRSGTSLEHPKASSRLRRRPAQASAVHPLARLAPRRPNLSHHERPSEGPWKNPWQALGRCCEGLGGGAWQSWEVLGSRLAGVWKTLGSFRGVLGVRGPSRSAQRLPVGCGACRRGPPPYTHVPGNGCRSGLAGSDRHTCETLERLAGSVAARWVATPSAI